MGFRRADVRLGGKELFIYYFKQLGLSNKSIHVGGCTNKRILSKKTGINYNTLMWVFTRRGLCYYENEDTLVLKLFTIDIEKGRQSMVRRGKGGMEHFVRYITKKDKNDY